MKMITAIIKPFKLDDVRQAVADIGLSGAVSACSSICTSVGRFGGI